MSDADAALRGDPKRAPAKPAVVKDWNPVLATAAVQAEYERRQAALKTVLAHSALVWERMWGRERALESWRQRAYKDDYRDVAAANPRPPELG
jgi:hypothetical protein